MFGREKCMDCGRTSPETNDDTTLTTSFGWRIRKGLDAAGGNAVEWRCPACWQRFKNAQQAAGAHAGISSSRPPRGPQGEGTGR